MAQDGKSTSVFAYNKSVFIALYITPYEWLKWEECPSDP